MQYIVSQIAQLKCKTQIIILITVIVYWLHAPSLSMQLIKLLLMQLLLVNGQDPGKRGQFPGRKTAEDRERSEYNEL